MLGIPEVQFLGHMASARGIIPLPEKVAAICGFPQPGTVGQLMSYLGMINFYRRLIKGAAGVLKPLTDPLCGASCKGARIEWSPPMLTTFEGSKQQMVQATHLAHPGKKARLALSVDASGTHVGATLQQEMSQGSQQPPGFFCRKLNTPEQKYSAFDRELLAVYAAIRHFRWVLEGKRSYVLSYHMPLTFALHRQSDAWSTRQQQHLSYVAEYTSDIRHVAGKENVVANCLSRPPDVLSLPRSTKVASIKVPFGSLAPPVAWDGSPGASSTVAVVTPGAVLDMAELACAQEGCQETQELHAKMAAQLISGHKIWCDSSLGMLRPLVPVSMHCQVFNSVHSLAHPGVPGAC